MGKWVSNSERSVEDSDLKTFSMQIEYMLNNKRRRLSLLSNDTLNLVRRILRISYALIESLQFL